MSKTVRRDEQGLVAIMVTIVLMMVITLVALSFSSIIRREQTSQLDTQLSSRAYYAAESGVNLLQKRVADGSVNPSLVTEADSTNCMPPGINASDMVLDADSEVAVTCLGVTNRLPDIIFDAVSNKWTRFPINAVRVAGSGATIDQLTISWSGKDVSGSGCPAGSTTFRTSSEWAAQCGGMPLIHLEIVPANAATTRDNLRTQLFSAYLYPVSSGGAASYAYASGVGQANFGQLLPVRCSGSSCRVVLSGMPSTNNYVARVSSLYGSSSVNVGYRTDSADILAGNFAFEGTQLLIDSTGKAQNVVRRIQVRQSANNQVTTGLPDSPFVSSGGACKRVVLEGGTNVTDECN